MARNFAKVDVKKIRQIAAGALTGGAASMVGKKTVLKAAIKKIRGTQVGSGVITGLGVAKDTGKKLGTKVREAVKAIGKKIQGPTTEEYQQEILKKKGFGAYKNFVDQKTKNRRTTEGGYMPNRKK